MLVVFVYISSHFGTVHSTNVSHNLKCKKSLITPLFLVLKLFKVADFGVSQNDLWDFL